MDKKYCEYCALRDICTYDCGGCDGPFDEDDPCIEEAYIEFERYNFRDEWFKYNADRGD